MPHETRIAIAGAAGRMGRTLIAACTEQPGLQLTADRGVQMPISKQCRDQGLSLPGCEGFGVPSDTEGGVPFYGCISTRVV